MERRDDAVLCQHLVRAGAVPLGELVACAEAQRALREAGRPVPPLDRLLLERGLLTQAQVAAHRATAEAAAAAAAAAPQRRRRRAGSSSGRHLAASDAGDGVRPGDRLGCYEVEEPVARGSMGAVWAARCQRTGARVAVKVLASDRAARDVSVRRFVQEAQLACSLRHEAVVRGLAFGLDAGRRYYVMELVPGASLRARVKQGTPLAAPEVAAIGARVARALAYLHGEGVVHRDVKPANVLLPPDGAKLCDLGLAREVELPSEVTASGDTLGTPRYMAPEQARGDKDVGPPADLYALGTTLFHAACGRPPFLEESGIVVLSRHIYDEVPDPRTVRPDLHPGLAAAIRRLTRKDPRARFASAAEAALALEALDPAAARRAA